MSNRVISAPTNVKVSGFRTVAHLLATIVRNVPDHIGDAGEKRRDSSLQQAIHLDEANILPIN